MKAIQTIGASLVLLLLITACQNPVMKPKSEKFSGNVIIRIAGADSRTVLPATPTDYSKIELELQKKVEEPNEPEDPIVHTYTDGKDISKLTGDGFGISLSPGEWTITLKAYRSIEGEDVLAAQGSDTKTVDTRMVTWIEIKLKSFAINGSTDPGVFKYTVTLPPVDLAAATLSLKNNNGDEVAGYEALNLKETGNRSGSIVLDSGYYDLNVILTNQNGQSAGAFEVVHIYSGLESPLNLDLSTVAFADKVYIAGSLNGIRRGTVGVYSDAGGTGAIKKIELNEVELSGTSAVRSANWVIDIPSSYVGSPVWVVQEFNDVPGIKETKEIASVPVNGKADIVLSLKPTTLDRVNIAPWYATISASGTGSGNTNPSLAANNSTGNYWQSAREDEGPVWLELDFGFDVTVNASRLIFYSATGSVYLDGYTVEYSADNGLTWNLATTTGSHKHFSGSTDGSVRYSNFFTEKTARKFRWSITGLDGQAPGLIEFGLYKSYDRSALGDIIETAQAEHDNVLVQVSEQDGADVELGKAWVLPAVKRAYQNAIDAARKVWDDPCVDEAGIEKAERDLRDAIAAYNGVARGEGSSGSIKVLDFHVQDGYKDKFVVKWQNEQDKKYVLSISADNSNWEQLDVFNETPGTGNPVLFSYEVGTNKGITEQMTRYFKIQSFRGSAEGDVEESGACMTLGVPVVSLVNNGPSYNTVSLSWTMAQKADTFLLNYTYSNGGGGTVDLKANQLSNNGTVYTYSFQPEEYNNPAKSGMQMQVEVKASNSTLWDVDGTFFTTSDPITTRLVGPAELNASATKATSTNNIALSWSPVEGAAGYYVFRRQFNMNNTAQESVAIAYYVPNEQNSSLTVTGKNVAAGNGETTTTKASAGFASGRFTLTDSWMNDSEYNGIYNSYTGNYKNQQNDIARGNPYRYFIVPVVANQTLGSIGFAYSNNNAASYTIQAGGETITYSNAAALETTGFTLGFGQNVTATKGTYASSGNVNNGIQITWTPPPLLAGTGVTPQYTVYRKAYNASAWETAATAVTGTQYVSSNESKGVLYEYAVGINGSTPHTSDRFISLGRPATQGYMLDMVKLQGVSRNEIKVGNEFGEDVTLLSGGVKNGGTDTNWGIDGYTVYVMNRNINANWHIIADDVSAAASTSATQVVRVTTGQSSFDGMDLLKVLRDYKHYFKVRSYVLNNGVKVYSPDPDWNFETLFAASRNDQDNANFIQNDYVKWGARQITPTEFTRVATLFMTWGIHAVNGNSTSSWTSTLSAYWRNTNGNNGSSGRVGSQSSSGVGRWYFYFDNYKPDLDTNANRNNWTYSTTFVTIEGSSDTYSSKNIYADSTASSRFPNWYGRYGAYGSDYVGIQGPSCVSPLYTGQLRFGNDSTNLSWGSGFVDIKYPASAAAVQITGAQTNTPLPFQDQTSSFWGSSHRYSNDAWY